MARKIRIVLTSSRPGNAPRPVPLSKILEGPVQARFWSRVQKGAPDDCWPFLGAPNSEGYGIVNISLGYKNPKKVRAHVFALMSHTKQKNTRGVLHSLKCTTKMCVNPNHLRWGNQKENAIDARELGKVPGQKLTWEEVDEIRGLLSRGYPGVGVAALFGLNQSTVSAIKLGRRWNPETRSTAA